MTKMQAKYLGDLRVQCRHESGALLETDAPKDNFGKGEKFSPTDLLPIALATCMLTLMGITAQKLGIDLRGATFDVEKEMAKAPRRIARIQATFRCSFMPTIEIQQKLEEAAMSCPVHHSLHPEIVQDIHFHWGV